MAITRILILFVALVFFLLAGLDIKATRVNLLAIGLVFLTVALMFNGR